MKLRNDCPRLLKYVKLKVDDNIKGIEPSTQIVNSDLVIKWNIYVKLKYIFFRKAINNCKKIRIIVSYQLSN